MKPIFSTYLLTAFTLNAIASAIAYGFTPTPENIKEFDRIKNNGDTINNWQYWNVAPTSDNHNPTFIIPNNAIYGYDYGYQFSDSHSSVIQIAFPLQIMDL